MAAANLFEMPERTSNFGQIQLGLMRAFPVDVFGVVAVPAKKAEIFRESKFDDYVIPAATRNAKVFGFARVVASRIDIPISLCVVNGQELLEVLTTARALVAVVGEHNSLSFSALFTLPSQSLRGSLSVVFPRIWPSFSSAFFTETFPTFDAALSTDTSSPEFFETRITLESLLFGCHSVVTANSIACNIREALNKLQVELMMA